VDRSGRRAGAPDGAVSRLEGAPPSWYSQRARAHVHTTPPHSAPKCVQQYRHSQQYRLRHLLAAQGPNVMCQVGCLQRRWRRLTRRTSDLSLATHRGRHSALHLSSSSPQLCSSHRSCQATLTLWLTPRWRASSAAGRWSHRTPALPS